jgi:three-Cys-motif partner protein
MAKQKFGGEWTEDKLSRIKEYLEAYSTALKHQPFRREYIDAFAGTGYREVKCDETDETTLFPELAEPEVRQFLDGSARIALNVEPAFHRFTFIEKKPTKVKDLLKLKDDFPTKDIRIEQGDANTWVQSICRESWDYRRAVLFLDPFGMQVSWQTLEAVAATRSIDTWILFPLCVGITRLLSKNEVPDESRRKPLDVIFGDRSWVDAFYRRRSPSSRAKAQRTFFDELEDDANTVQRIDFSAIEDYYRGRLRTIFAGVANNAVRLKNSKNVPLYLLFFVAGNLKGAPIAVKIAESIMRGPYRSLTLPSVAGQS